MQLCMRCTRHGRAGRRGHCDLWSRPMSRTRRKSPPKPVKRRKRDARPFWEAKRLEEKKKKEEEDARRSAEPQPDRTRRRFLSAWF